MKKAVYLTIGSVLLASSIVATSVLLPTLTSINNVNTFYLYNFNPNNSTDLENVDLQLSSANYKSINTKYQDLIVGNSNINNGNYVLCITSQGYSSHNSFLYGTQGNDYIDSTVSETNQQPILNGNFGLGLKTIPNLETQPYVLIVQDVLTEDDYNDKEQFENMVREYKNIDTAAATEDSTSDDYKKKSWASSVEANFSFEPGKTYTTWDEKTAYYRTTNKFPILFNEIVAFVKSMFNNLSNIDSSSGIIIGYNNNKLNSDYSGSFSSTTSDDSTSEDSSGDTSTQSIFYSSFSTRSNNPFADWLKENYGTKK